MQQGVIAYTRVGSGMSCICSSRHAIRMSSDVFFFQAEDGIRVFHVTGVQTCALPIYQAKILQRWQRQEDFGLMFSTVDRLIKERKASGEEGAKKKDLDRKSVV